jgi:hypothetical protein
MLARQSLVSDSAIDLISFKRNVGYGRAAEMGFAVADMYDPHYCFFIESDYIFRKHGLDELMEVFASDVGQHAAGFGGYSHPDFFAAEGLQRLRQEKLNRHGKDGPDWDMLYKPVRFKSSFGEIRTQFVSNSCGTMYLNWRMISEMRGMFYPRMEREWIKCTCRRDGPHAVLDDGAMSQTLAFFWNQYAVKMGWDLNKYSALLDILPSAANHLSGGGINGNFGLREGQTHVGSPSFPQNYNEYQSGS